jgi:hypothetical protein
MLGFESRTVHPPALSTNPLRYSGSIQTPDGPSSNPFITPTTLCPFHSSKRRSIPQPSQYNHYAISVLFKPGTVHPPVLSIQPLCHAGSIQTPDALFPNPVLTHTKLCPFHPSQTQPTPSPVNTPSNLCLFHSNPGRSIPQPSQKTDYDMAVPFKPRTIHLPT